MKTILPPNRVEEAVHFSNATNKSLGVNEDETIQGRIFNDGRSAWIAKGTALEVICTANGQRQCAYRFGEARNAEVSMRVTCVANFTVGSLCQQLLVGLSYGNDRGLLCVFDVRVSKVVVAIRVPNPVTSVEHVNVTGACPLRHMHGVVAVGTRGGQVYLVDLALDLGRYSDENDPQDVVPTIPQPGRDLAESRASALNQERHLAVVINDDSSSRSYFTYGPSKREMVFPSRDVSVTAVKFLPQLGHLAIGYNIGTFQLWNVNTFVFDYSSSYERSPPVLGFTFQEPENDPKLFCYLWAVHGHLRSEDHQDTATKANLYSLTFQRKKMEEGYGWARYEGLSLVNLRFEYQLDSGQVSERKPQHANSQLVTCYAVSNCGNVEGGYAGLNAEEGVAGLCVFVWYSAAARNTGLKATIAVFDLNQWYLAQMPSYYRYNESELCPYFGFFLLDDVLEKVALNVPLDVYIPPHKICSFVASAAAEQQFYPSALSFDTVCLTANGIISASYLGLQRQVLAHLKAAGPSLLLEPRELYTMCQFSSLVPQALRGVANITTKQNTERECIFSLAIEQNKPDFVMDCVSQWATGEFSHLECSPRMIQEWVWKKAGQIKSAVDRFCGSLFDFSGISPDEASICQTRQQVSQLKQLAIIFQALLSPAVPTTDLGLKECESKQNAINLLVVYAEVILWFLNCNLLPETVDGDRDLMDAVVYPSEFLKRIYEDRRQELKRLDGAIRGTELLMIDGLIGHYGQMVTGLWDKEGGNGLYPPPNLHALLNVYLLDGVPAWEKHRIVQYLFLDLTALLPAERHEQGMNLVRFPSSFALSPSLIKLTQGFWLLDHKDFEEAMSVLLDPLVNPSDIAHWQHMRILKSLLYQNQFQKALKYARLRMPAFETAEDVRLMLTILLANGQVSEAFFYQRENRDDTNFEDLICHFFSGCQQTKNMDKLLQLPLSCSEEDALIRHLRNGGWPRSREVLVMYLLQRGRYAEAFKLNEELTAAYTGELDPATKERATVRNAVVNGYSSLLPRVQSTLSLKSNSRTAIKRLKEAAKPIPLSAHMNKSSGQLVTQSSVLMDMVEKIKEIWARTPCEATPFRRWRRADSDEDPEGQSAPFVRPPATPASKMSVDRTSVICFPSVTKKTERPMTEANDLTASPTKKSRYMDLSPFKTRDSTAKRSPPKYYAAEAQTLLQTPPVRRKVANLSMGTSTAADITPHSILKVRRILHPPGSPTGSEETRRSVASLSFDVATVEASGRVSAESHQTNEEEESSDTSARHLRFQVTPGSSSDVTMEESPSPRAEEPSALRRCKLAEVNQKSIHASPRRPLHFSDDVESIREADAEQEEDTGAIPPPDKPEQSVEDADSMDIAEEFKEEDIGLKTAVEVGEESEDGEEVEESGSSMTVTPDVVIVREDPEDQEEHSEELVTVASVVLETLVEEEGDGDRKVEEDVEEEEEEEDEKVEEEEEEEEKVEEVEEEEEKVEEEEEEEEEKVEEHEEVEKVLPRMTRSSSSMSASPTSSVASLSPVTRSRTRLMDGKMGTRSSQKTSPVEAKPVVPTSERRSSVRKKKLQPQTQTDDTIVESVAESEEKDVDTPLPKLATSRHKSVATPGTRRSLRYSSPLLREAAFSGKPLSAATAGFGEAKFSFSTPTVLLDEAEAEDLPSATKPDKSFIFSPPVTRSHTRRTRKESDTESVSSDMSIEPVTSVTSTYSLRSNRRQSVAKSSSEASDTPINFLTRSSAPSTSTTPSGTTTATRRPTATRKPHLHRGGKRFVKFR